MDPNGGVMSDLLDKTIHIGIGLEKKAREVLEELEKAGGAAAEQRTDAEKPEGSDRASEPGDRSAELSARQLIENRVVEDGIKVIREFLEIVEAGKKKLIGEVSGGAGKVAGRLHVATSEELDIVKEMARVAREKVERLEKRVVELEKGSGPGGD